MNAKLEEIDGKYVATLDRLCRARGAAQAGYRQEAGAAA